MNYQMDNSYCHLFRTNPAGLHILPTRIIEKLRQFPYVVLELGTEFRSRVPSFLKFIYKNIVTLGQ